MEIKVNKLRVMSRKRFKSFKETNGKYYCNAKDYWYTDKIGLKHRGYKKVYCNSAVKSYIRYDGLTAHIVALDNNCLYAKYLSDKEISNYKE